MFSNRLAGGKAGRGPEISPLAGYPNFCGVAGSNQPYNPLSYRRYMNRERSLSYGHHSSIAKAKKMLSSKICSGIVNLLGNLINGVEATIEALDIWGLINADFNDEYAYVWLMVILGLVLVKVIYLSIRWVISMARRKRSSGD